MTIRYTCGECATVLKIRDQLAGTRAKCPRCKTQFQIPAGTDAPTTRKKKERTPPPESLDDLIDMPQEVTPKIMMSNSDEFDPLDVLFESSGESDNTLSVEQKTSEAPKPSVAELMKEHEAKQRKKNRKSPGKSSKRSVAEAVAATKAFTSGSASDAIARTYDQKRSQTSDAPPLTRAERREAEYRDAAKTFGIKATASISVTLLLGGMLLYWVFSTAVPDLVSVTGVVTQQNKPLANVSIQFAPISTDRKEQLENAIPSTGYTNADGSYIMMYDLRNAGVLPGTHNVSISTPSGIVFRLSPQELHQTVELGEDYEINFNVK